MPEISIITINFNNRAGLQQTIESVVAQSFKDFEYIVIDGNSTDGSKELLTAFDKKINYWVSEPDSGIYNAMNKGISKAKGNYLLFLNSGDHLVDSEVLLKVAQQLDGSGIVYGDILTQEPGGRQSYDASPDKPDLEHFMVSTLWHPASFIQKKVFDQYGKYSEELRMASDYEFFIRAVIRHKVSTRHMHLPVAVFEKNGISSNPKYFELMVWERKRVQASLFSRQELVQLRLLEIRLLGRRSKVFKLVPGNETLKNLYDKFYYRWYRWRTNSKLFNHE